MKPFHDRSRSEKMTPKRLVWEMPGAGESAPTQPTQTVEAITTVESLNAHLGQLDGEVNQRLQEIEGLIARVDAYAKSTGADPRLAYQMRQRLQQTISAISTQNEDIRFNMNRLRAMLSRQATGMLEKLDYASDAITLFAPAWEHLRNGRFQQGFRDFLRYGRLLINAFFGKGEIPQARQTSGETPAETVQQNITSLNNIRNLDQMAIGSDGYANHQVGNDQWRAKYNGANLVLEKRVNNNFTVQQNPTTQPLHRYLEQPENKRDLGRLMQGISGDTNNKRLQLAVKLTKVQKLMGTGKNAINLAYERRASFPGSGDLVDKITHLSDADLKTRLEAAANSAAALGEAYTRVPSLNELGVSSDNKITFKLPNSTTEYRINKDGTSLQQKPSGQTAFADYTINDQTPVALRSVRDYFDGIKNDLTAIATKFNNGSNDAFKTNLSVVLMEVQLAENNGSNQPKLNISEFLKNTAIPLNYTITTRQTTTLERMRKTLPLAITGIRTEIRQAKEGMDDIANIEIGTENSRQAQEGYFVYSATVDGRRTLLSVRFNGTVVREFQNSTNQFFRLENPEQKTKLHYFLRGHAEKLRSLGPQLLSSSSNTVMAGLARNLVKHQKDLNAQPNTQIDAINELADHLAIYKQEQSKTNEQIIQLLNGEPNAESRAMFQRLTQY